jgi:quercetin dioxygenase-like cupin family protein
VVLGFVLVKEGQEIPSIGYSASLAATVLGGSSTTKTSSRLEATGPAARRHLGRKGREIAMSVVLVHSDQVAPDTVREPGARHATIRRLIDTLDGAHHLVLNLLELAPNGSIPVRHHDWEHEVFVLGGKLFLELPGEGRRLTLKGGDVVLVPRNEKHGFTTEEKGARLLLLAPAEQPPALTGSPSEGSTQRKEQASRPMTG